MHLFDQTAAYKVDQSNHRDEWKSAPVSLGTNGRALRASWWQDKLDAALASTAPDAEYEYAVAA